MRMVGLAWVMAALIGTSAAWGDAPKLELEHRETRLGRLPERTLPDQVSVSPDGKRIAYLASKGVKVMVVVDGKESKLYEWIVGNHIGFTADSQHVVYQIRRDDKLVMVIDNTEGPAYAAMDGWICSPQGGRVAYVAKKHGRFVPVIDGVEGKAYDTARLGALTEMGHVALVAGIGGKDCLVVDGVEGRLFDEIQDVRMSPDGKRVAYRAQRNADQWYMVVDGVPGKAYPQVQPPCLSADGRRVGYLAGSDQQQVLVVDGQELPTAAGRPVAGPVFSPDGKRLAYVVAKEGDTAAVVVDDVTGPVYDSVSHVGFSPDGQRVAYVAQRGSRSTVVLEGIEQGQFEKVDPDSVTFSGDGRHLAWVASREGKQFIVVDGVEGKPYDRILFHNGLGFADNQTIFAIAALERQIQRPREDNSDQVIPIRRYDLVGLEISINAR
ncbi:MAG TPA: hypothetical protein VHP11_09875 [Tepidisphaeraceae bacterium]|nr:hypothetical protein [Tepidisphaeraceae bacterium]